MPGFGRRKSLDPRDRLFSIAAVLPPPSIRLWRNWWDNGWWGDQGNTNHCVGYAWEHWVDDGPTVHAVRPLYNPVGIYQSAQQVDEWPGENYEGTSVRGGAKVLKDLGRISEYRWAFSLDEIVRAILQVGPVVMGTNWYDSMMTPGRWGRVQIAGPVVGGHAYVLNGVNTITRRFRIKNSWGRGWGAHGRAFIGYDDMARLLAEDGEACLAVEIADA